MNFKEAYKSLQDGLLIKRPEWKGYWSMNNSDIIFHSDDGASSDIRNIVSVANLFDDLAAEDFLVVTGSSTPNLIGSLRIRAQHTSGMSFKEALEKMKVGAKIALPDWYCWWTWENDTIFLNSLRYEKKRIQDVWWDEPRWEDFGSEDFIELS